jgi:hypothetical protein
MLDKDPVSKARLLHKYEGLHWLDGNGLLQVGKSDDMDWKGGRNGNGWSLIGVLDGNGGVESWSFHNVIDLIVKYQQPVELNVEREYDEDKRDSNFERLDAITEAKKATAEEKRKEAVERKKAAEAKKLMN